MTAAQRVFLSASVPLPQRDKKYYSTADVIAIRDAVRALTSVAIEKNFKLVFGGHPAITPMIKTQIKQSDQSVGKLVYLYKSNYFTRTFSEDESDFTSVTLTDSIDDDRGKSLSEMRRKMIGGQFDAGFFIGGMEGVEEEYSIFVQTHPNVPAWPIASTGAAAARLYDSNSELQAHHPELRQELSYLGLMRRLVDEATQQDRADGLPKLVIMDAGRRITTGVEQRFAQVREPLSRLHGNTRVDVLRKVYGPHFARGLSAKAKLTEILPSLDDASRDTLLIDFEAGQLGSKIKGAG